VTQAAPSSQAALPRTGSGAVALLVALGVGLIAGGLALVAIRRRARI